MIAHPRAWLIGADPSCDVVVDRPTVSGRHCRLTWTGGGYTLEDLKSSNGTFVNGARIEQATAVTPADRILLGRSVAMPWPKDVEDGATAAGRPSHPPQSDLKLVQPATVLGRDRSCDLVLDDPLVSRRHARLVRSPQHVTIEDIHSSNGTFVNGERIVETRTLKPGDLVSIGRFTFKLAPDDCFERRDYRGSVAIEARGLMVDIPGRRLLEDVSLTVRPAELVALMGPSGAGKTTLLNALNGYTPPTAGRVFFNNRDLYAHFAQFQGLVGYVPQDDIMHRGLTVGQALYFTARLRLPSDFSHEEIRKRAAEVVAQLGLQGTENVLIGSPEKKGISGGQRKRVNLAMELLTDPAILFLDEPTSGLSSEDALMVMKLLRRLADAGKTIIVTIHQPSLEVYRLLDNLIVVAKDARSAGPGRLAYYGPAWPQAVDFFNPGGVPGLKPGAEPSPDEVLRGLARDETSAWVERYRASPLKRQFVDERTGKQPDEQLATAQRNAPRAAGLGQWRTLVRRGLAVKLRDRANTAILLAQAPIIALLVVFVFGKRAAEVVTAENWQSVAYASSVTVFLMGLAALWFGCSNAAREVVGEWAIYHRERMVNLKIPSYVGSKFAVLGGLCLLQCAVLLGVVRWGAGLQGPWLPMFLLLVLSSLVSLGIGLTVSSLARSSEVAAAVLPLILLPMVMLGGILQPLHEMNTPVHWLAQTMPSRWAFEGLIVLEAKDRPKWRPPAAPRTRRPSDAKTSMEQDIAEPYFPRTDKRTGAFVSGIALTLMLALLVGAVLAVLRSRDVH